MQRSRRKVKHERVIPCGSALMLDQLNISKSKAKLVTSKNDRSGCVRPVSMKIVWADMELRIQAMQEVLGTITERGLDERPTRAKVGDRFWFNWHSTNVFLSKG